jgi:hypothetical protein
VAVRVDKLQDHLLLLKRLEAAHADVPGWCVEHPIEGR